MPAVQDGSIKQSGAHVMGDSVLTVDNSNGDIVNPMGGHSLIISLSESISLVSSVDYDLIYTINGTYVSSIVRIGSNLGNNRWNCIVQ